MLSRFKPLGPDDPSEIAGYPLRARLGSGGMGTVYLSFSRGGRPVAIKAVKADFADDPEFRRRFGREIAAAQRVQGHFTAPVVDADPDAPVPWLATAYVAGPSLQSAVGEHGPLPLLTVFRLLAGAAEGIENVHAAGLVHRDLKPANVLLAEDGPRVIDFGIAHAANSSTLTGKGNAVGTPGYMAPEQIRGKVTGATDVFGLGQLAVYAATGHPAFGEGTAEALFYRILNEPPDLDGCPAELRPIAERCLAKEPADRPSAGEVVDQARAAIRGDTMRVLNQPWLPQPVAATLRDYAPSTAPEPPTRPVSRPAPHPVTEIVPPPKRRRRLGRLLTIPAVIILAAGGYLGYQVGHSGDASAAGAADSSSPPRAPAATPDSLVTTPAPPVMTTPPTGPAPDPSPSTSGVPDPDAGYLVVYQDQQFVMQGGGCAGGGSYVAASAWLGSTQPEVSTNSSSVQLGGDDLDIGCNYTSTGAALAHDNDQMTVISGSPGPAACAAAVTTVPLTGNQIPYSQLKAGEQFCAFISTGNAVALLTLVDVSSVSDDLTWTASVWSKPTT
jgi:eukaryotic-like serine/threonine-protein kinase